MAKGIKVGYVWISILTALTCFFILLLALLDLVTAAVDLSAASELDGIIDVRSEVLVGLVRTCAAAAMVAGVLFVAASVVRGQTEMTWRLSWACLGVFAAAFVMRPVWMGDSTLVTAVQGLWVIATFWLLHTFHAGLTDVHPQE